MLSGLRRVFLIIFATLLAVAASSSSAKAAGCDQYASPSGSDGSGNGTLSSPYRTVGQLDSSLSPGQTGCLLSGTYGSISTQHDLDNSGAPGQDITITTAPAQSATVVGLVDLNGSYTALSGLDIDGSNNLYSSERPGTSCPYPVSNGLEINGRQDIFQYNDFYQSIPSLRGNGIGIGWNGHADGTIVRYNRIHDLGQCEAFDQMIYISEGTGIQVYDNWMWNDPHGFGVQIYPAAVDSHVFANVIDRAGSGITVGGDPGVSGNVVEHNVIMNSTGLPTAGDVRGVGISDSWDSTAGTGNVFRANDVFDDPGGIANVSAVAVSENTTVNPGLTDPLGHDYRIALGSPLTFWGLWDGGVGPSSATVTGAKARAARAQHRHHKHRHRHRHRRRRRKHHK